MKNFTKTIGKIASIAAFTILSFNASAADWTIIQTATITTASPDLKQGDDASVNGSVQSLNGIALQPDADSLVGFSSQSAIVTATATLTLNQGPNVTASSQSLNYIEAQRIGNAGEGVTQDVTSVSTATTLTQEVVSGGDGNTQALNIAKSADTSGAVAVLNQSVSEQGTLDLDQIAVNTAQNVQAVNYAFGETIGINVSDRLEQNTGVTGAIDFRQSGTGSENTQGGNVIVTSATGNIVSAEQVVTAATNITFTQDTPTGGNNRQAANLANTIANGTGDVGTLTQRYTSSAGAATFVSNAGSDANVQAINLVDTLGTIVDLSQTVTVSATTIADFDQTGGGNSNIQAGNMARTDGSLSSIEGIAQLFTGSATANDFNQETGASNTVQAGNLIDLGNAGGIADLSGPHQTFTTVGTVTMTQLGGGTSNLQALNATVDNPGGAPTVNLSQSLSALGSSFTMAQNAMANSGQFGNYAGENYQQ